MKFFVENDFTVEELDIFYRIRQAVLQLPDDIDQGKLGKNETGEPVILSCHILARAVANVYGLECQDGFFSKEGCYSHSWLITSSGNIIDVYPVGILGGPILVESLVAGRLYIDPKSIKRNPKYFKGLPVFNDPDKIFSEPWFCEAVEIVAQMLREIEY